jgi:asparagine synthase (glutamine-hydrolysing)
VSGIAGIVHLDGRPVDPALVRRMIDAARERGPDADGLWLDGHVGFGHVMLHTTPESLQEKQPLTDEAGQLALTLDGRIDNRDEVVPALVARGARFRTDTDAELVLRAYEHWGEECPPRLLGDFAFALWDARRRQLFCARDAIGIRPFHYLASAGAFVFASEVRQILVHPLATSEPNEGMVAEFLADQITSRQDTLYRDVTRLPGAHALVLRDGRVRTWRYWDVDPERRIRYRTDAEYAEHFRAVFTEAVRCRLRSHRPVGAELSGGLDSSSIVGMAQHLYRAGRATDHGFETFSWVYPGKPHDESRYIDDVVGLWGVRNYRAENFLPAPRSFAANARRFQDFPHTPGGPSDDDALRLRARDRGLRSLLTGIGGDECVGGRLQHYADMLRGFKVGALLRQVRVGRGSAYTFPPQPLLRLGVWPLLPSGVRHAVKRVLGRSGRAGPPWLPADFVRRTNLLERVRRDGGRGPFPTFEQKVIHDYLNSGDLARCVESDDRCTAAFGLELRHPLLDRRLVELALALPGDQRWRGTHTKFVLRQAMHGVLPESVRGRTTKAEFIPFFLEVFSTLGGARMFDRLGIEGCGWIDGAQVRAMYPRMETLRARGDLGYPGLVWALWMVYGTDLWFTSRRRIE